MKRDPFLVLLAIACVVFAFVAPTVNLWFLLASPALVWAATKYYEWSEL